MFDESVTNVNSIKASSTSGLVSKTQYDSETKIENNSNKLPNITELIRKAYDNTRRLKMK